MAFNYGMNLATDALAGAAEKYYAGKLANAQAVPQLMGQKQQLDLGKQQLAQGEQTMAQKNALFPGQLRNQQQQGLLTDAQLKETLAKIEAMPIDAELKRRLTESEIAYHTAQAQPKPIVPHFNPKTGEEVHYNTQGNRVVVEPPPQPKSPHDLLYEAETAKVKAETDQVGKPKPMSEYDRQRLAIQRETAATRAKQVDATIARGSKSMNPQVAQAFKGLGLQKQVISTQLANITKKLMAIPPPTDEVRAALEAQEADLNRRLDAIDLSAQTLTVVGNVSQTPGLGGPPKPTTPEAEADAYLKSLGVQ